MGEEGPRSTGIPSSAWAREDTPALPDPYLPWEEMEAQRCGVTHTALPSSCEGKAHGAPEPVSAVDSLQGPRDSRGEGWKVGVEEWWGPQPPTHQLCDPGQVTWPTCASVSPPVNGDDRGTYPRGLF